MFTVTMCNYDFYKYIYNFQKKLGVNLYLVLVKHFVLSFNVAFEQVI